MQKVAPQVRCAFFCSCVKLCFLSSFLDSSRFEIFLSAFFALFVSRNSLDPGKIDLATLPVCKDSNQSTDGDMQTVGLNHFNCGHLSDASRDEIKRAYRRIAKRLHPDRRGGDPMPSAGSLRHNHLIQGDKSGSSRAQHSQGIRLSRKDQTTGNA